MNSYIKILPVIFLLTAGPLLNAQTDPDSTAKSASRTAFLRVGYNPINLAQSRSFSPGIFVEWEKPISPHLTLGVNLYRDLAASTPWRMDEISRTGQLADRPLYTYRDIRTSLSINAQYYFKPNVYEGFYAALKVTNVAAEVVTREDYALGVPGRHKLSFRPRVGLYLGYRKVFGKGFFIDGSAGYLLDNKEVGTGRLSNSNHLDLKFSLGWQLNFKKKKK